MNQTMKLILLSVMSFQFCQAQHVDSIKTIEQGNNYKTMITTVQGEVYYGNYISATDTSVTYATKDAVVIIQKRDILSAIKIPPQITDKSKKGLTRKVQLKEYKQLPALVLGIAGGIGTYLAFKKSSDYSDAAAAYGLLKMNAQKDDAETNASYYKNIGFGVGILSTVLIIWGLTPTTTEIEQPIEVAATNQGIRVNIRF